MSPKTGVTWTVVAVFRAEGLYPNSHSASGWPAGLPPPDLSHGANRTVGHSAL